MMFPYLSDYVRKYNCVDHELCEQIYKSMTPLDEKWQQHSWTVYNGVGENGTETHHDDLKVTYDISEEQQAGLMDSISIAAQMYFRDLNLGNLVNAYSKPRLNRYIEGTRMAKHHDNIVSLFEQGMGSPTLTVLGCIHNDSVGGEFLMFDNTQVVMERGDILVFPSAFMYPHEVLPVKSGERWTFVSWGF